MQKKTNRVQHGDGAGTLKVMKRHTILPHPRRNKTNKSLLHSVLVQIYSGGAAVKHNTELITRATNFSDSA